MYRDLGLGWPRFTSDPRVKSVLGKLKTGVGVVLAAPTQSNCGDAADCLRPEKGLLHFTVTGSLESLLKFKRTISNWLGHVGKETQFKKKIKGKEYCHGTMPEPRSPVSSDTHTFYFVSDSLFNCAIRFFCLFVSLTKAVTSGRSSVVILKRSSDISKSGKDTLFLPLFPPHNSSLQVFMFLSWASCKDLGEFV